MASVSEVCEICEENKIADTYCCECQQYMCSVCSGHHSRVRSTKNHKTVTGKDLEEPSRHLSTSAVICQNHPDKLLEYFCSDHDVNCCPACVFEHHRPCRDVRELSKASEGFAQNSEALQILEKIKRLTEKFEQVKAEEQEELRSIEHEVQSVINLIHRTRTQINMLLDKVEADTKSRLEALREKEKDFVTGRIKSCQKHIQTIGQRKLELEQAMQQNTDEILFIFTKSVKSSILKEYNPSMVELQWEARQVKLELNIDTNIHSLLTHLQTFGEIKNKTICNVTRTTSTGSASRKWKQKGYANIKLTSDEKVCEIKSILQTDDGMFLVTDCANDRLKVLDQSYSRTQRMLTLYRPWGMAMVQRDQVAVVLPELYKIQLVKIGDELQLGKEIETKGEYYSIAWTGEHFILGSWSSSPLKILDFDGNEIRKFQTGVPTEKEEIYGIPYSIALDNTRSLIYVSNQHKSSIHIISLTDDKKHLVLSGVCNPVGMDVDRHGNVFVCVANKVCMFTADGDPKQDIINELSCPICVFVCKDNATLLVGSKKSNFIEIFCTT